MGTCTEDLVLARFSLSPSQESRNVGNYQKSRSELWQKEVKKYENPVESAISISLWEDVTEVEAIELNLEGWRKFKRKRRGESSFQIVHECVNILSSSSSRERGFHSKGRRTINWGWPWIGVARQTRRQEVSFTAGWPHGMGTVDSALSTEWVAAPFSCFQLWDSMYLQCLSQAGFVQHCQDKELLL